MEVNSAALLLKGRRLKPPAILYGSGPEVSENMLGYTQTIYSFF